jgi:POT family proton-dependent oligopeptide transporter
LAERIQSSPNAASAELFGHPKGLTFLFTTEMWERFSYYGMRALLVLYMTKYLLVPEHAGNVIGLAGIKSALEAVFGPLDVQPLSSQIYGLYTALVYLTPIFGGLLADRVLGQRRTVVIGAILMAIGHFMMAVEPLFLFALTALILGNGAFKPNISTQVGGLYAPGDRRRDRAYSIFYVGINVGAFLAPLICGTLGEEAGWHYGFAAAGVGMLIGLAIYLYAMPLLPPDELQKAKAAHIAKRPLDRDEWRAVVALLVLFVPNTLFWATYEQQGNTIALWADANTDRTVNLLLWAGEIPTTWFQAFNPFMIFAFTPFVVALWTRQAARATEPSTITKMALGCVGVCEPHHGGCGVLRGRRRQGELAMAVRVFRRHHHRRALSLAGRVIAGDQGRPRAHPLDDDGGVAGDQFCRQFPRRLARQLLEPHGQAGILPDDRRYRSARQRGDLRLPLAAARNVAGVTQ